MPKLSPENLDAAQRNYVLGRITAVQQDKANSIYADRSQVDLMRAAALKVINSANAEHIKNALLVQLGYATPDYKRSHNSLAARVQAAANAVKNPTTVRLAKLKREADRVRDSVMLGGSASEFATLLKQFADLKV